METEELQAKIFEAMQELRFRACQDSIGRMIKGDQLHVVIRGEKYDVDVKLTLRKSQGKPIRDTEISGVKVPVWVGE